MNENGQNEHSARVDAWLERATKGLPPERLVEVFEQAFDALWQRAHQTLGEVTLAAIAERVLHYAAERHPLLAPLELDADGMRWEQLRTQARSMPADQLENAMRFAVGEFIRVLGSLTAEILTPSLHAVLAELPRENGHDENSRRSGSPPSRAKEAKS